jgi:hypothetical protein
LLDERRDDALGRGGHIWPASTWPRDQVMRVCGSGDVRRRRLPCRSGKAVYWRAALPLGHATTFAAAQWRRAHLGPRRGTSSCRYRCRSRPSRYWVSETWRAPCLWRPLPASLAGGAGARPDHPINGHWLAWTDVENCLLSACGYEIESGNETTRNHYFG